MSHFTCLVIGENPEEMLEPFDEGLEVDEYCVGEVSEETKKGFIDYLTENGKNPDNLGYDELYAIHGEEWDGGRCRKDSDGIWKEYSTYNPDSKWDWYQLGGRWTGTLKLKSNAEGFVGEPGLMTDEAQTGYVDQTYKCNIDIVGMRDEAENNCRKRYDEVCKIFGGTIPKVEHKWSTIIDGDNPYFNKMSIEEKREFYHNQPALKEVDKHKKELGYFFEIEEYDKPLDLLVKEARDSALSTFAILYDGKWYERGTMGWWASVSNEKEKSEWTQEFSEIFDSLPDDTLISIYDCHI